MDPRQRGRPFEIINRIRLRVETSWRANYKGYYLSYNGSRFGFVRYNIGDSQGHKGEFAVYVYPPYQDPRQLFVDRHENNPSPVTHVHPSNEERIEQVVAVLEFAARLRW